MTKNKKKIIILNKMDLADEAETLKWKEFFSKEAECCITVDSNSGKGIDKVTKKIDEIMKEEKEKAAARGRINKTIRCMILGIPNVGKSSFINRIAKKNAQEVANRPGVTRNNQWIRISKDQELLDTPGVLWPKLDSKEVSLNLAFTGTIKDEILESTEIAYELLKKLVKDHKSKVLERFKISEEELKQAENVSNSTYELMKLIALKRGALVAGGKPDIDKVSKIIIDDFRSGKIGKITLEKVS